MKRLLFPLLLLTACANREEVADAPVLQDSFAAPIVTVIADLPDSLQPKVVMLDTMPEPKSFVVPAEMVEGANPVSINEVGRYNFTVYSSADGLALDGAVVAFTDSRGRLWFGTSGGGVSCFDGSSFINYTDVHGLDMGSTAICEDAMGRIWLGNQNYGVACYDGKSLKRFSEQEGLARNTVSCSKGTRDGKVWIGTTKGLSCFYEDSFTNYYKKDGLLSNNITSLAEDDKGTLWIGTDGGLSCYSGGRFKNFTVKDGLAGNIVTRILQDKNGLLWLGTNNGVSVYDGNVFRNFTTADGLIANFIRDMAQDSDGNIWFCTRSGLSCYNTRVEPVTSGSFANFTTANGLTTNDIYCVTIDKNGKPWFGTMGGGVCRFEGKAFINFSEGRALTSTFVKSITEDSKGNIWIGTDSGLTRFDGTYFTQYKHPAISGVWIMAVYEDKNSNLWLATSGFGVIRFDGETFTRFTTRQGLPSNTIMCITEDVAGVLWFGTANKGLCRYDGRSFINYTTKQGLISDYIWTITEDHAGNLWMGSYNNGLSCYNGKSFTNYTTQQGLSHGQVWRILEDSTGNLWIGTSAGLNIMTAAIRKQGHELTPGPPLFKAFTQKDGLSDNWIGQMAFLPDGKIAVATNMGLNLFTMPGDLSRLENMTLLGNRTGYPVTDVNAAQTSLFVDSKGIIWLCCSYEGTSLLRYDPSALDNDSTQPNVIIKSVLINEEAVSWSSLLPIQEATENTTPAFAMEEADIYGGELSQPERDSLRKKYTGVKFDSLSDFYHVPQNLELPYQHNHITIRFNAIQPGRPQGVRYRYMLEGYDKNWGPVTQNTGAVFGHIREGKYTFKVKAQSADGVWSEPLEYTFSVLPPWYRTWWMYTTYVLLFLSGLRIFSKWRERSLMADNEKLEKTVKERTKEIAEEKKKSDDLLLNILPEEVADELKERGATTAQQYDHVTVLFTDFVNFTTAGEHMGSQALVEELHNCFKAFDEILDKYNIEKIKTIGDAYLAVCGLPTADQRHAEKIVQAAQEIRAFMLQRRQQLGDKTFEIRIGIHSGSVVAGIVGVKKFAYDIWGDTVNTAARMEQNSEAGKINISQTTYELVQDNFTCSYRGEIEAKGKGELKMYFVE